GGEQKWDQQSDPTRQARIARAAHRDTDKREIKNGERQRLEPHCDDDAERPACAADPPAAADRNNTRQDKWKAGNARDKQPDAQKGSPDKRLPPHGSVVFEHSNACESFTIRPEGYESTTILQASVA